MLIYVLWWWPSWISNRHKKHKFGKGYSNDQLFTIWVQSVLGWSCTKSLFFIPVGYSTWLPGPIICSDWLKFQRSSSLILMNWLNPNCKQLIIGISLKVYRRRTTDDGRQVMAIVHLGLWSKWTNKCSDREGILNNTNLYITVFYQRSLV
jgi:hypothetical protein